MTDTTGAPGSTDPHCTDPHDHTGHDHPPTGADLVQDLVKGLSILALLIPVLAVVMLLAILPAAPPAPSCCCWASLSVPRISSPWW